MPASAERGWTHPDRSAVVAHARELGLRSIRLPRHAELFSRAFATSCVDPGSQELELRISLAPLAFSATTGSADSRHDLAALTLVLWTAVDLLDDVADGDLGAEWAEYDANELVVMASSLLAGTSHLVVASLHAPPPVAARLHERIARGLCTMADGQIADIAHTGRNDVSADAIVASIAGKTGAECAMFAGLGAILAEAPAERVEHFERFGLEFGIASQLLSDVADACSLEGGRDLANRTRTLPLAWHLDSLSGAARVAFFEALDAAPADDRVASGVREALLASPALRRCVLQIMVHIERARSALALAGPTGPAASVLTDFLDGLNPLGPAYSGR
ncbi:MAG: polyprenyl synthetase family protein [Vulcanimicrobiaceae bacterium]